MKFTLGSDPEVFLKKVINGREEYFPAIGIIEGDKYNPQPVGDNGRNVLVDNVMLEFNTVPALNKSEFVQEHLDFLNYITKDMENEECTISNECFVEFKPHFLDSEIAQTFGCEPDFNAYTLKSNIPPRGDVNTRSAAGHIHVGYDNPNKEDSIALIKLLDLTLGVPSVIDDPDRNRRKMYGKAGCYRLKSFGFEYRTLSNYWIFNEKNLKKIYEGVEKAFELHKKGLSLTREDENLVINTINNYDVKSAKLLINKYLKTEKLCVD